MLKKQKKFFTKNSITLIVASIIILALLIVLTSTGALHHTETCSLCNGNKYSEEICKECGGDGIARVTCEACEGEGCELCDEGKVLATCEVCGGTECTHETTICENCDGTGKEKCQLCGGEGEGMGSIWALLPPIIAIGLALITKEVFSSLFIGILSGAILAADFSPLGSLDNVINTGLISAVEGTAGIFIFLIELGILVALVNKAGGSKAFGEWAEKHVKTRVGACIMTFILGVLIFIDDYFNCLTVGSVMRPITDKHKVSRSKLAYLIDATAAPICMIAPISSWAAAVSQYAADGQGFKLFIMAIPMNFYSILTLVFVIAISLMKIDFGPMRQHEINAQHGDLFSGKQVKQEELVTSERGKVLDLILPIIILIVSCVFALIYVGGIFDGSSFIDAFADTDATVALPWGGLIALIFTIIYMAIRKTVSFKESMDSIPKGFIAMVPAILILTFATALKNMTSELGAAFYVGNLVNGAASTLMSLLPAIIFLVACVLAFATGTSWGTFGILIPIVVAIFPTTNGIVPELQVVGISACLAGAVCGDHCSPISDTTIMSSAGAECEHINHVSTQLPYAIYVAVISFVCFIVAGFVPNWYVMLPLSIAIMIGSLFAVKYFVKKSSTGVKGVKDIPTK